MAWRLSVRSFVSFVLVAFTLSLFAPATVAAPSEGQYKQAKEHFERGKRLYEVGRYGDAIEEYQKAYLAVPEPSFLYNIALAYRLWDKPDEAVRFFRTFLRNEPTTNLRDDVEKKIADLEKLIDQRRRAGLMAPVPPAATEPAVPAPPVAKPPVAIAPPATAPPAGASSPSIGVTDHMPAPERPSRVLPYTLLGVGGAMILGSLVAGGIAKSKGDEIEKLSMMGGAFDRSIEDSGRTASNVAIGASLVGLAAATTGLILLWTSPAPTTAASASLLPSVFPMVGSGLAGAGARGAF